MKRCKKPENEPECLTSFRNLNPEAEWNEFRNHDVQQCYQDLRNILSENQVKLCAYCETKLRKVNQQIAHFHPKSDLSGPTNWALKWSNLWLACKGGSQAWMNDTAEYLPPLPENLSCDEVKGNKILDDIVLAPDEIPIFPRIFKYEQKTDVIDILPDEENCKEAGIPIEKVDRTISEFNLNCRRLGEARLSLLRAMEQQVKRLRERSDNPQHHFPLLVQRFLYNDSDGSWRRFFTLARWRFDTYAEDYLLERGYQG